jgi:predicted nucleic acid binding AN1-type Zn finger protein
MIKYSERTEINIVFKCSHCRYYDCLNPIEFRDCENDIGEVVWSCAECGEDFTISNMLDCDDLTKIIT